MTTHSSMPPPFLWYTILGKTSLTNADWTAVAPGAESDYNFFKVRVEMK